jgi:precorrin isomerase
MNSEIGSPEREMKRKSLPLIHRFYASPLSGEEIEAKSMERIEKEAPPHSLGPDEWQVVRRMIHTTGDFSLIDAVRFSPESIPTAIDALQKGRPIYVDSKMIRSGLSLPRLQAVYPDYDLNDIVCHVADGDVTQQALQTGLPRSLFAIQKARSILKGGLAIFGNSPIALLELNRLILEEQIRPALVVAMPVGFVHVEESKEELMSLDIPHIALAGRRGGSPLAVSVIHALCSIAGGERYKKDTSAGKSPSLSKTEAVILMGHGSRVPGAGKDMEAVAQRLRKKYGYSRIEICFMSGLGPSLPEALEKCVKSGFTWILVIPYFLHMGVHLLQDIPRMMQKEARKYPNVKLILGKGFGFDEAVVDLVEQRIQESKDLYDVRDMALPEREQYSVPNREG